MTLVSYYIMAVPPASKPNAITITILMAMSTRAPAIGQAPAQMGTAYRRRCPEVPL
jgi:hypothetical protein